MIEQMNADVVAIEPEGQVPFVYDGKGYVCQRTPMVDKLAMADAGYESNVDLMIDVRTSQFTGSIRPPSNQETITIADVEYRIVTTTPDQYGIVNTYGVKQNT